MADFQKAIQKVLKVEGGYQKLEGDLGNYSAYDNSGNYVARDQRKGRTNLAGTNYGISASMYSSLKKRAVTEQEIRELTLSEAINIYRIAFWNRIQGDKIRDQQLAEIIFDGKVNHGSTGIVLLQRLINSMGANIEVDGAFGPITLSAVNRLNPERLYNGYIEVRKAFYNQLADNGFSQFLKGWLNRLGFLWLLQ